jgi:hypothetical protein
MIDCEICVFVRIHVVNTMGLNILSMDHVVARTCKKKKKTR